MATGCWFSKSLGDGMWAWESLDELKELFSSEYIQNGYPKEMAVFTRHESEGRLHCELIAYFSPASIVVAKKVDAKPCVRPIPAGLSLLVGSKDSWLALFQIH
jgi:hypothetical protein